ncbi:Cof-type HAD-IIB family hydrolase [Marinomonas sp.]|uniref:Cof-type HAD-IIB family hydrolase n=1 Tax=Marinomonas sp. TaxID=1904862 RepID=UPI003BA91E9E
MYELLALDLDGTVLKSDRTISPTLIAKIRELSERIPVMIVTGRHHTTARPYYLELGLKTPIICCNGAYVYDYQNEQVLQHNALSKDVAKQFVSLAEKHDVTAVMYVTNAMLHSKHRPLPYVEALSEWASTFPIGSRPQIYKVDNFHQEIERHSFVWKFVLEGREVDHFAASPFIQQHFNGEYSWTNRIDFARIGNTKGAALTEYLEKIGISADRIVAVGDHHNDISMLTLAGMGVAMLNADENIQRLADRVTTATNDDDFALADLIDQLFLTEGESK